MSNVPELLPAARELLLGFEWRRIATSGAEIHRAVGGSGPPPLLGWGT